MRRHSTRDFSNVFLFLLQMTRKIIPFFLFLTVLLGNNHPIYSQELRESDLLKSVSQAKSSEQRYERMLVLGKYYLANNIHKADSLEEILLRDSRNFEDSVRFSALMFSAEVTLIRGDLDSYFNTILACQPFLNKLKSDDVQFTIYRHLGFYHSNMQEYETAQTYLNMSLRKAKRMHDIGKESEAYRYIAMNFMRGNAKDSAIYYSDKALSSGRRSGNKAIQSQAFNTKARIYDFYGQVELSVAKNLIALQLAEEVRNTLLLATYCREVGRSQELILNLDDAEYYFRRSLDYSRQINDRRQMALALTNLASVQLDRHQYDKAIKNATRSIQLLTNLNDLNGLGATHNILGMVYNEQGNYNQASLNFNQALVYYESTSNKEEIAGCWCFKCAFTSRYSICCF